MYAYEDVTFLHFLYDKLRAGLEHRNLINIHASLTANRSPPRILPTNHPLHLPASHIAIALMDRNLVVCLHDPNSNQSSLPFGIIDDVASLSHTGLKQRAAKIWRDCMGKPSSLVAQAVNAKM